jgi:hypothetical protein
VGPDLQFSDPEEEAEYQKFKKFWERLQFEANQRRIDYERLISERMAQDRHPH